MRTSKVQGSGVFATQRIPKGTLICEYVGERISHDEADNRYNDESMERHHTFLMAVNDKIVIDGAVGGNESRFINHSCEPNCEPRIKRARAYIYAIRDIEEGEELLYDYAYERDDDEDEHAEKHYICHCGAPSCRGTILEPKNDSD